MGRNVSTSVVSVVSVGIPDQYPGLKEVIYESTINSSNKCEKINVIL